MRVLVRLLFFPELLVEVFGEGVMDSPPECDRAHRSLTEKPKLGQRPRPIIIRLHRYQQKEMIICEARAKRGRLQYHGTPIAIYEDYAPEVMEQRYAYRVLCRSSMSWGSGQLCCFPQGFQSNEGGR
ncbi:hypothetical protein NHX12_011821 [Muraenolepis orangiensis]|uniref:Uncharacterized protein n=1 Tax=Muraenolepis orangiensis TaxID=630683 RepID=A0A9Q0DKG9_9TELE|nr:hypothetical protein NHX12_011821 [Muraenolepis orangiensis]